MLQLSYDLKTKRHEFPKMLQIILNFQSKGDANSGQLVNFNREASFGIIIFSYRGLNHDVVKTVLTLKFESEP